MDLPLPLDKMSVEEKLRAIELLWEDLCRTPSAVPLPAGDRKLLDERLKRYKEGKEPSIPLEEARERLRRRKP